MYTLDTFSGLLTSVEVITACCKLISDTKEICRGAAVAARMTSFFKIKDQMSIQNGKKYDKDAVTDLIDDFDSLRDGIMAGVDAFGIDTTIK